MSNDFKPRPPAPGIVERQLVSKAAHALLPDELADMPLPMRLDRAAAKITSTIPVRLYEEVRQLTMQLSSPIYSCCPSGNHSPNEPSCIPGRQLKAVLDELEEALAL